MPSPEATVARARTDVRFHSGETECAGVFIRPETTDDVPCVVFAHGFGALKEGGPVRMAERFAGEGYAGLAFDYRYFGESGGEPRQLLSAKHQLDDWRAAIAFARAQDGIDAGRIVLWGSSFSGGHGMALAAEDHSIAAVIAQAPYTDGPKTLLALGPLQNVRLAIAGLRDLFSSAFGGENLIPIVGPPGATAAMTTSDAEPGYRAMYDEGFEWRNEFTARAALTLPFYSPGKRTEAIGCPLLVQVCSDDAITPPAPAIEAAHRAREGELVTYAGIGHFEIYRGEHLERAAADQIDFLQRHLA
jgi:uncharacterized protein